MTEFAKIASAIRMWGWGRAWMVLAAVLLLKHVVPFDQALILILFNVVMDRLVTGNNRRRHKMAVPRPWSKIGGGRNRSCQSKAGRLVPAADWLPRLPEPHSSKNGIHRKLCARRIENEPHINEPCYSLFCSDSSASCTSATSRAKCFV